MIGTTDYISIKLTDETQFRSIFDKYYISLCMFANQYVENDAVAADIVQECFVKLWQLRDDFMYVLDFHDAPLYNFHKCEFYRV